MLLYFLEILLAKFLCIMLILARPERGIPGITGFAGSKLRAFISSGCPTRGESNGERGDA